MYEKSASAAELFLIKALQSKKVKLYGQTSYGAGDKLDAYSFDIGYCNYWVSIPVSLRIGESYRKPIDMVGVKPHEYLPKNCKDVLKFIITNRQFPK
jgi:C-terminal processing protease CtpA/Prc